MKRGQIDFVIGALSVPCDWWWLTFVACKRGLPTRRLRRIDRAHPAGSPCVCTTDDLLTRTPYEHFTCDALGDRAVPFVHAKETAHVCVTRCPPRDRLVFLLFETSERVPCNNGFHFFVGIFPSLFGAREPSVTLKFDIFFTCLHIKSLVKLEFYGKNFIIFSNLNLFSFFLTTISIYLFLYNILF